MLILLSSIGSLWSVSILQLKHATSLYEIVECLRAIRSVLQDIDRSDRMKFCKADYENAVKILKKNRQLWSPDLFRETISITLRYFDTCVFLKLPTVLLYEIILWLPTSDLASILSVCNDWKILASHNDLWRQLYQRKFLLSNPGAFPSQSYPVIDSYRWRLDDPQVGDKVEVAWKGKFRLETQDVYQGLAWWVAEVVEKNKEQGKYKIRYPGWESRWDEWVPRARLRWSVAPNTIEHIDIGDVVELWCIGQNVPGAWLESKVKKVRGNRYCLGKVLSSGSLWVERERLRLVRKAYDYDIHDRYSLENRRGGNGQGLLGSISQSFSSMVARPTSCSIM
jgi:hypothetical protein